MHARYVLTVCLAIKHLSAEITGWQLWQLRLEGAGKQESDCLY